MLVLLYTILADRYDLFLPMLEGKLSYILRILVKYTKYLSLHGDHTILTYV